MIKISKTLVQGICLALLFLTQTYAQESKSLLWEISGNGLKQPSYLYGTIHAICEKDFILTAATQKAFAQSQQLYLEIDMDDPSLMGEIQKSMFMTDGTTLKKLLSESDYKKVATFFKDSLQTNIDMIPTIKPFALSSLTMSKLLNCPMKSYEAVFTSMATEQQKQILGLESVQEQMGAIDKMGYAKQAQVMLVKMVDEWNKGKEEFKSLINAYKQQDLNALLHIMLQSSSMDAAFQQDMLVTRNLSWIPRIKTFIAEKPSFIAVGAGHLGGKEGVIALLKAQGYTLKPVK